MDFHPVFINRKEYALLKRFKRHKSIDISDKINEYTVTDPILSTLVDFRFVKQNARYDAQTRMDVYENTASITKLGMDYIEFVRRSRCYNLIPYIITTAISLLALAKSYEAEIISALRLLKQWLQ